MLNLAKEKMKYTCWTEISSIGKSGTVLLGRGAAAYKLHRKKVKSNGKTKTNIRVKLQ